MCAMSCDAERRMTFARYRAILPNDNCHTYMTYDTYMTDPVPDLMHLSLR